MVKMYLYQQQWCKKCNYVCRHTGDFNKHLKTKKHVQNENKHATKIYQCSCGKIYKSRGGLFYHNKKCVSKTPKQESTAVKKINLPVNNLIIQELFEQNKKRECENADLKALILSNCGTNNIINNNNNTTINVFLKEHCKDAMFLEDFVDEIQVTIDDLLHTCEVGHAAGVSTVFINNLNNLPAIKRPIHCSDVKRNKFYVNRKKNGWIKGDDANYYVERVIQRITDKQMDAILKWQDATPNYFTDDKLQEHWFRIIREAAGPTRDNEREKDKNLIKKRVGNASCLKDAIKNTNK